MSFLNEIGIDKAAFDEAADTTVTAQFEVLPSGVYPATIDSMVLYKQDGKTKDGKTFSATKLKVTVKLDESERLVSYKSDVSKLLKDGTANGGFLARLKSIGIATNFNIDDLKMGDEVTVNSFGKDCKGQALLGVNGKSVLALVRMAVDTNKAEGEAYRETNELEAISHKGADDIADFEAKIEKNGGVFNYKGYVKPSTGSATMSQTEAKEAMKKVDF